MNICEQKQNMKEAFGVYLRKRYDVNINESPYKDISFIDESLKEDLDNDGLYSIDSVKVFDEVINKLKENGRYDELIEKSQEEEANDYSEVLDNYREFLIAYQFAQEWVKPRKTEYEDNKFALNTIVFGAPGTGKSHSINDFIEKNNATYTDVTFHPDTDYASFVGCYKPAKGQEGDLTYTFVPQAFIKAYIKAWELPKDEIHVLRIEEINRGNCAQIFGDIFQLLDRYEEDTEKGTKGQSKYTIDADADLKEYLFSKFNSNNNSTYYFSDIKNEKIRKEVENGEKLLLPSNLYILATMNTSDQSLYPMDSAFKRRWEWKYIPISYDNRIKYIVTDPKNKKGYSWEDFLKAINKRIYDTTKSEDKQFGFWFTGESQVISASTFVNKVVFYLWNDVFKDYHDENSPFGSLTFQSFYFGNGNIKMDVVKDFLNNLGLNLQDDVFFCIEQSKQHQESQSSSKRRLQVTFPDGTVINEKNDAQLLDAVIEKVGPKKVHDLNIRVAGGPLVAVNIEEIQDISSYRQTAKKHQLSNGMFVFTNSNKTQKIKQLKRIAKETGLNFIVEDLDQLSTEDENSD